MALGQKKPVAFRHRVATGVAMLPGVKTAPPSSACNVALRHLMQELFTPEKAARWTAGPGG